MCRVQPSVISDETLLHSSQNKKHSHCNYETLKLDWEANYMLPPSLPFTPVS